MAGLASGRLNRRITLRRAKLVSDGRGAQTSTWEDLGTVWGEAISQNGREAVIAGALAGVSAWRVALRFSALTRSLTTDDQLVLDGRELNIRAVEDPDGRREQIVIFADSASVQR